MFNNNFNTKDIGFLLTNHSGYFIDTSNESLHNLMFFRDSNISIGYSCNNSVSTTDIYGNVNIFGTLTYNDIIINGGSSGSNSQWITAPNVPENGETSIYILNSNVGIGTSVPNYTLDVWGTFNIHDKLSVSTNEILVNLPINTQNNDINLGSGSIYAENLFVKNQTSNLLIHNNNSNTVALTVIQDQSATNSSTIANFYDNTSNSIPVLTIQASKVGINTSNPHTNLEINGTFSVTCNNNILLDVSSNHFDFGYNNLVVPYIISKQIQAIDVYTIQLHTSNIFSSNITANAVIANNFIGNATTATSANSAIYAVSANSASYATSANLATYAGYATSTNSATYAGYATSTNSASYSGYATSTNSATYAMYTNSATYAGYAISTNSATYAGYATSTNSTTYAGYATSANSATYAGYATSTNSATYAGYATSTNSATYAGYATSTNSATYAGYATSTNSATYAGYATSTNSGTYAGYATSTNSANERVLYFYRYKYGLL